MCHKIRHALTDRATNFVLDDHCGVDEAFYGGRKQKGNRGRAQNSDKAMIVRAVKKVWCRVGEMDEPYRVHPAERRQHRDQCGFRGTSREGAWGSRHEARPLRPRPYLQRPPRRGARPLEDMPDTALARSPAKIFPPSSGLRTAHGPGLWRTRRLAIGGGSDHIVGRRARRHPRGGKARRRPARFIGTCRCGSLFRAKPYSG